MLPLRRRTDLPAMMRHTLAVRSLLKQSDGLVGYALDAQLRRNIFWTVSAWVDDDALRVFAHSGAHVAAMRVLGGKLLAPKLLSWTCDGAAIPITWITAHNRLSS
jgi:hypothetical protein